MKVALACIASLALATLAHAQDAQKADVPQIAVTGEATVSVPPDLATIDAGASTDGKTAREASDANNATMGKVLLALKGAGIDDKDLQTERLSLHPVYAQRATEGPMVMTGYRASNRINVRLRDLARIASIIDLAVGAGANQIGGVSFRVAEPSKLLDDARAQAIADARRKAEIYAKAVGADLGAPLGVSEEGASPPARMRRMDTSMDMRASAPIAPGEQTLRIAISVSWEIKAKAQ